MYGPGRSDWPVLSFILGPSPFKQRNLKGRLKGYLKGGLRGVQGTLGGRGLKGGLEGGA